MKFHKQKKSALAGHTEIIFTQEPSEGEKPFPAWRIVADRSGIRFEGNSLTISNLQELEEFAKVVSDAWADHQEQVPKIISHSGGAAGH